MEATAMERILGKYKLPQDLKPLLGLFHFAERNDIRGPTTKGLPLVIYNAAYLPLIAGIAYGIQNLVQ